MQKHSPLPPILTVIVSMMALICATSWLVGGWALWAVLPLLLLWAVCLAGSLLLWAKISKIEKTTRNVAEVFASRFEGLLRATRLVTLLTICTQVVTALLTLGLGVYALFAPNNLLAAAVGIVGGAAELLLGVLIARKPLTILLALGQPVSFTPAGYELSADTNPGLWDALFVLSERLGTPCANRVLVGEAPGVFLTGLTLYLSLSSLRVLSMDELGALVAHEFAHLREETNLAQAARTQLLRTHRAAMTRVFAKGAAGPVLALLGALLRAFQSGAEASSRARELAADRAAAAVIDPQTLGTALTRELIIPLWWERAVSMDAADTAFPTRAHKVESIARTLGDTAPDIGALNQRRAAHPLDEHPTHIVRMTALQATTKLALQEALLIPDPNDTAITLIDDQEAIHMQLTKSRRSAPESMPEMAQPKRAAHSVETLYDPAAEMAEDQHAEAYVIDVQPAAQFTAAAPNAPTLLIPASRGARVRMTALTGAGAGVFGLIALLIIGGTLIDMLSGYRPSSALVVLLIGLFVAGIAALFGLVCRRYVRLMLANKPALRLTGKGIRSYSELSNGDLLRWSELSDITLADIDVAGMAQTLFFVPHNRGAVLQRFSTVQKLGIKLFGAALQAPHYISSGHVTIPMAEVYKLVANYYALNIASPEQQLSELSFEEASEVVAPEARLEHVDDTSHAYAAQPDAVRIEEPAEIAPAPVAVNPRAQQPAPVPVPEPEPVYESVAAAGPAQDEPSLLDYAKQVAQGTLDVFADALTAAKKDKHARFALRVLTPDDSGASVWLTDAVLEDDGEGIFSGGIVEAEHPFAKGKLVKSDERVNVAHSSVIDWLIVSKDIGQGGFSLRTQRSTMPAAEQRAWDAQVSIKFNDAAIGMSFDEQLHAAVREMQLA